MCGLSTSRTKRLGSIAGVVDSSAEQIADFPPLLELGLALLQSVVEVLDRLIEARGALARRRQVAAVRDRTHVVAPFFVPARLAHRLRRRVAGVRIVIVVVIADDRTRSCDG